MPNTSAFIPLEDCIKGAMRDAFDGNTAEYQRNMSWAMDCVNELGYDVLKNFKRAFIGVDTATMTARLPDDFVQSTQIGLVTNNNEFIPLAYNPSLVINPTTPTCDAVSDHCDCGCNDEYCYALGESNMTTTYTDVVINGTTYQDSVTVCVQSNGDTVQKTCNYVVTNPTQKCTYTIVIQMDNPLVPFSNVVITKNNATIFIGDVASTTEMKAVLNAYGFNTSSSAGIEVTGVITATADVWNSLSYTTNTGLNLSVNFAQSACETPTPTVEQYCYEEKICEVEVLPCGCIVPTDTSINVLCNTGCFQNFGWAVTSRQRNNKDFGQTFAQPKGFFGEYNIDIYAGIIQFNWDYQYDTVFIEYYSANLVTSKEYLIPVQAKETVIAWIYWKSLQRKKSADKWEKQMARSEYYNEKRKLKQRLNPFNLDLMMQVTRVFQRP